MKPSAKLYDLPETLVVRKPFNIGTARFKVGDVFDRAKAGGLKDRRIQQMWDQRWIGTPAELERDKSRWEAKKDATKAAQKSAEKVEVEEPVPVEEPRRGRRRQAPVTQDEPERPVTVEDLDL